METLVRDGRLTVPLYHGTSTLFSESIFQYGLGGRNMIEQLGLRRAAGLLVEKCREFEANDDWLEGIDACIKIAHEPNLQPESGPILSFLRYGGTYVSASRATAATYARSYNHGSEALTYTLRLLEKAEAIFPHLAFRKEFSVIRAAGKKPKQPLLIQARRVPISGLRSERGGEIEPVLRRISLALEEGRRDYQLFVQQANFELTQSVPPAQLHILRMSKAELGLTRHR